MNNKELVAALLDAGLAIDTFTESEINKTNTDIKDINLAAFKKLCFFRAAIGVPVRFCKNGIVAKGHKSNGHTIGTAFDVYIIKAPFYKVFKTAINTGLTKFGGYYNGAVYSYHLEDSAAAFWSATKDENNNWDFKGLIIDPKYT